MLIWLTYFAAAKAETKELGRIAFACGLLAFLIRFGMEAVSALGK